MLRVLIADDDGPNRQVLGIFCRERPDLAVQLARSGREALAAVRAGDVDAVFTDLRMPEMSGEELLEAVKGSHPHVPVVVMTGYGTIESAVELLRRGAHDYLTKPITRDVFLHRLDRVLDQVKLTREVRRLEREVADQVEPGHTLIGNSAPMVALGKQLPTVAQSEASVVIYGQSGTGKEVVARTLHRLSPRSQSAFVTVNCGALPEHLLESELFGHRKGAFTGAHQDQPGIVGAANGGTLFLDEIGEVSPAVQVKLLRFLENKEYRPVGSPEARIADVRIIAATLRDLHEAVAEGTFREDLYYRLEVVPLHLPALDDRPGDVPILARHFLARFNHRLGRRVELDEPGLRALERQTWPGNVRQLENRIEQLVVMSPDGPVPIERIEAGRAAPVTTPRAVPPALRGTYREEKAHLLARFEDDYFRALLHEEHGHLTRVAKRAGLDRKNLWQILKRRGLEARTFKGHAGREKT